MNSLTQSCFCSRCHLVDLTSRTTTTRNFVLKSDAKVKRLDKRDIFDSCVPNRTASEAGISLAVDERKYSQLIYNLKLSWRLNSVKSSRAHSRVNWCPVETDVSVTISVPG
jgi:hypothetical protein